MYNVPILSIFFCNMQHYGIFNRECHVKLIKLFTGEGEATHCLQKYIKITVTALYITPFLQLSLENEIENHTLCLQVLFEIIVSSMFHCTVHMLNVCRRL